MPPQRHSSGVLAVLGGDVLDLASSKVMRAIITALSMASAGRFSALGLGAPLVPQERHDISYFPAPLEHQHIRRPRREGVARRPGHKTEPIRITGIKVYSVEPEGPALSPHAATFSAVCLATISNPLRQDA